jgi:hypothetical protein
MYLPLSRHRRPTVRECRAASLLCMIGFVGFIWMMLNMPDAITAFLGELSLVLILLWLGLGTVIHGMPNQGLLWPQFGARTGSGNKHPPLDERDHDIRHRTFLIAYRLLCATLFAIVVLPGVLGPRVMHTVTDRFRTNGPLDLGLMIVAMLTALSFLLPYWVLPWLESDPPPGAEADLEAKTSERAVHGSPNARRWWIVLLGNVLLWALVLATMLWVFASTSPVGFYRLWR